MMKIYIIRAGVFLSMMLPLAGFSTEGNIKTRMSGTAKIEQESASQLKDKIVSLESGNVAVSVDEISSNGSSGKQVTAHSNVVKSSSAVSSNSKSGANEKSSLRPLRFNAPQDQ